MSDLMRVIAHGRGHVPGVTIIGDKIEAWPEDAGPKPTAEELERWAAELAALDGKVSVVTMRQARLALLAAGKLAAVESAVAAAGTAAQIEWEYATEVRRDWPLVNALAGAVGIDGEALDALFVAAAQL